MSIPEFLLWVPKEILGFRLTQRLILPHIPVGTTGCDYTSYTIIALARISALWAIQSAEIVAENARVVRGPLHPLSNIPVAPIPSEWVLPCPAPSLWYDLHLPPPTFEVRKT